MKTLDTSFGKMADDFSMTEIIQRESPDKSDDAILAGFNSLSINIFNTRQNLSTTSNNV